MKERKGKLREGEVKKTKTGDKRVVSCRRKRIVRMSKRRERIRAISVKGKRSLRKM